MKIRIRVKMRGLKYFTCGRSMVGSIELSKRYESLELLNKLIVTLGPKESIT